MLNSASPPPLPSQAHAIPTNEIVSDEVFAPLIDQRGENVAVRAIPGQNQMSLVRGVLQSASIPRRVLALPEVVELDGLGVKARVRLRCEE